MAKNAQKGQQPEFLEYKVVVCGSGVKNGAGKSCITNRFVTGFFTEDYDPTIEDSYTANVTVDNEPGVIDILDSAGQEEYSAMLDQYLRHGQGYIVVYSITSTKSFIDAQAYKDKIMRVRDLKPTDTIPMVLVGNKTDLESERKVSRNEGAELAKSFGCPFVECSAKMHTNIHEVFHEIIREIRKDRAIKGYELNKTTGPDEAMKEKIKRKFSSWANIGAEAMKFFSSFADRFRKKKEPAKAVPSSNSSSNLSTSSPSNNKSAQSIGNTSLSSHQPNPTPQPMPTATAMPMKPTPTSMPPKQNLDLNNPDSPTPNTPDDFVTYPFFHDISAGDADTILQNAEPGTYLVRFSSQEGYLAVSFVDEGVEKALIGYNPQGCWLCDDPTIRAPNLGEFVQQLDHVLKHPYTKDKGYSTFPRKG